jgi:hypothetical protein
MGYLGFESQEEIPEKERNEETVITFNYDTLLDRLQRGLAFEPRASHSIPGNGGDSIPISNIRKSGYAAILKLHGSLNWRRENRSGPNVARAIDEFFAIGGAEDEVVLGTPGPKKRQLKGEILSAQWKEATRAITEANVIVFLGYRFPPTDADARTMILQAIQANQEPVLIVHTVLGPDLAADDSARLQGLLRYSLVGRIDLQGHPQPRPLPAGNRYYSLNGLPLLAEDFISVIPRNGILGLPAVAGA